MSPNPVPPIVTLTLNPCLDVSYEFPALIADQKVHAEHNRFDPGGNGVNVGRALKVLGQPATNCCFLAGEIGMLVQRLLESQLDHFQAIQIDGETRINCVLLEKEPVSQFEINGIGPTVKLEDIERMTASVLAAAGKGFGILTGSLPPGTSETIYGDLTEKLRQQGARAIVDTRGAMLKHAIVHHPFLIKPNQYELELHCGHPLTSLEMIADEARRIQQSGVTYVCVSLGREGSLLVGPDNCYHATAPAIEIRSTVGAGDSLVGGLVAGFARGDNPIDALRLGVSCGSGTAGQPGTQLFSSDDVSRLQDQIEIRTLDC